MIGISMEEMREAMSYGRDVEFTYHDEEYVMQEDLVEVDDEGPDVLCLTIWKEIPGEDRYRCIYKNPIPYITPTPDGYIDAILNEKCFDGKSFMEIEEEVTVDAIL